VAEIPHIAVIADAARPYDRQIIRGITQYIKQFANWSLYVEEDPLQRLPDLRAWRGQGIIANFDDRKVAVAVRGVSLPTVGFGGGYGWYDPQSRIPYFATDNVAIAQLAADHLIDLGFRSLAFYGYPRTRVNRWSEERAEAFRDRALEAGCRCSIHTGRYETARRWSNLQNSLAAWLRTLPTPLGLMACNDVRARHVLEACRTIGAKVPDDVAVVGVDNDEMVCELADPPLTSVEQGTERIGYHAAKVLDQMLRGEIPAQQRYVIAPMGIIPRRSTDTLAVADPDVARAMQFVRDHACLGIRISDVAKTVGSSRSSIERRFKLAVGRTVHAEIDRIRFERARQLVANTDLPLKQITLMAGFKYTSYMTRLFCQRLGLPPARYRKSCRH